MSDEPRYMKRKIISGHIETDPREKALIVHYEVEATVLGDQGEAMQVERKGYQKKIRLKTLNENSNVPRLAEEIVEKCNLIHPSKLPLVENLLCDLQRRQITEDTRADSQKDIERRRRREEKRRLQNARDERKRRDEEEAAKAEMVKLDDVDDYLEKLYEDSVEDKIAGTACILELAKDAVNLEVLIQNERLMGALSRVLSDDFKKNMDLVMNIVRIFWCFSNFTQMHNLLSTYRVGALTMQVVELELKRYQLRMTELEEQKKAGAESKADTQRLEKEQRKTKVWVKKQDKLMYVCFHVLFNLAEDVHVERKMVKKNIAHFLVHLLERTSPDLLILACSFLKKLSIFEENKNLMAELNLAEKLCKFVPCSNENLMQISLRLLFNLSFDPALREVMVKSSLIPKLVELLRRPPFRARTIRLLYHISIDDRCKSMFTYTEAIPIVMQLVIHFPQTMVARELVALAINLSWNNRNADLMCQGEGFNALLDRVLNTHDPLLMKVVRNLSQWTQQQQQQLGMTPAPGEHNPRRQGGGGERDYKQRGLWAPFVEPLLHIAVNTENHDLLVEVLGVLANLTQADLGEGQTWAGLVRSGNAVLPFLLKLLVPGFSQDDIVLEVVGFVSALALDPDVAPILAGSRLLKTFHELLREKQADPDLVVQLAFMFYRLLRHPETCEELLYGTELLQDLMSMASSRHPSDEGRRMIDMCLQLVVEQDRRPMEDGGGVGEIGAQVRARRFALHNAEWMEMAHGELEQERRGYEEDKQFFVEQDRQQMVGMEGGGDEYHEHPDMDADGFHWNHAGKRQEHLEMDMGVLEAEGNWESEGGQWEQRNSHSPHNTDINRYWQEQQNGGGRASAEQYQQQDYRGEEQHQR